MSSARKKLICPEYPRTLACLSGNSSNRLLSKWIMAVATIIILQVRTPNPMPCTRSFRMYYITTNLLHPYLFKRYKASKNYKAIIIQYRDSFPGITDCAYVKLVIFPHFPRL